MFKVVTVNGNIVTISFCREIQKYEYPAAFSSVLELEEEEEQEVLAACILSGGR